MTYAGLRSTGCFLCRKRKIKCDERKPNCTNCQNYGRECPGYCTKMPWVFRDESRKVELRAKKQTKRRKQTPGDATS